VVEGVWLFPFVVGTIGGVTSAGGGPKSAGTLESKNGFPVEDEVETEVEPPISVVEVDVCAVLPEDDALVVIRISSVAEPVVVAVELSSTEKVPVIMFP